MATAADSTILNEPVDTRPIARRLAGLRRSLRGWLVARGLGTWLACVLGMLMGSMILDRWFRFDFSQRAILLVLMTGVAAWLLWRFLLRPLGQRVSDDALLLEIEDRHPQLAESLISGYQLQRDQAAGPASRSPELAAAVIREAVKRAGEVDFGSVLNRPGGRINALRLAAGGLLAVALGIGVLSGGFFKTWFRRNLLLTADQWPRATVLELMGATGGRIIVPRGLDYRQLVEVTAGSRVKIVDVDLEIDQGGEKSLQRMKPTGRQDGREHVFVFHSIAEECRVRAIGGDDVTAWVDLVLVEPPAVESLALSVVPPAWTGRPEAPLEGPGPHAVIAGSRMNVTLAANKPLRSAIIAREGQQIAMQSGQAGSNLLTASLPDPDAGDAAAQAGVAGGQYALRLTDELGLLNIRDFGFEVRVRENQRPTVRASLLGISGLAVPNAHVPVLWSAADDFGIQSMAIDCRWFDEATPAGTKSVAVPGFQGGPLVDECPESVAVLELEPLGLQPGQTLRFQATAVDAAAPEALSGSGREFLVRIVTEEELLSDLLRREIEQRGVFQQAYDRQLELNSQLKEAVAALVAAEDQPRAARELESRLLGMYRIQRTIGTGCAAVGDRFDEFLVEVSNNRLDEQNLALDPERTIQSRFENEIIRPIRQLDEVLVSDAARRLDGMKRQIAEGAGLNAALTETAAVQERILESMRAILAAMQSSENFQEAVNRLLEIRRIEQNMRKEIDKSGKANDDVFDPIDGDK